NTISTICRIRPRIDEKPPIPENRPPPNKRPNRPAPRKPAARPPSSPLPGRLKKPPPDRLNRPPRTWEFGLEGWLKLRLNGCAAEGAVLVGGGAEKVREPREPDEKPPPTRASAEVIASVAGSASANAMAPALISPRIRKVKVMGVFPKTPQGGTAHKMGSS